MYIGDRQTFITTAVLESLFRVETVSIVRETEIGPLAGGIQMSASKRDDMKA
jgi:hypothetical protein